MSVHFLEKYKSYDELMKFCVAQNDTMIAQAKKVIELQEEVMHLKALLDGAVPTFSPELGTIDQSSKDEEIIAKLEIQKLRHHSMSRELTFEEARKLEIFTKVIAASNKGEKKEVFDTKSLSTQALLETLDKENVGN